MAITHHFVKSSKRPKLGFGNMLVKYVASKQINGVGFARCKFIFLSHNRLKCC